MKKWIIPMMLVLTVALAVDIQVTTTPSNYVIQEGTSFTLTTSVQNTGTSSTYKLRSVSASISLPSGLSASTTTKSIASSINYGSTQSTSFDINADVPSTYTITTTVDYAEDNGGTLTTGLQEVKTVDLTVVASGTTLGASATVEPPSSGSYYKAGTGGDTGIDVVFYVRNFMASSYSSELNSSFDTGTCPITISPSSVQTILGTGESLSSGAQTSVQWSISFTTAAANSCTITLSTNPSVSKTLNYKKSDSSSCSSASECWGGYCCSSACSSSSCSTGVDSGTPGSGSPGGGSPGGGGGDLQTTTVALSIESDVQKVTNNINLAEEFLIKSWLPENVNYLVQTVNDLISQIKEESNYTKKTELQERAQTILDYLSQTVPSITKIDEGSTPNEITSEDEDLITQAVLNSTNKKLFIHKNVTINKKYSVAEVKRGSLLKNITRVTIQITNPFDEKIEFTIIEQIPKDIANDVSIINSPTPFNVISEDPIIAWNLTLVKGEITSIYYSIESALNSDQVATTKSLVAELKEASVEGATTPPSEEGASIPAAKEQVGDVGSWPIVPLVVGWIIIGVVTVFLLVRKYHL